MEAYDIAIRPTKVSSLAEGDGWVTLVEQHKPHDLVLKPLLEGTSYEVRVRATNSKGSSDWKTASFVTKQKPLLVDAAANSGVGGMAGGSGPGYKWMQSLKDQGLHVTIGPLPAHTKARHIDVSFRPGRLAVSAFGQSLLDGELHAAIQPDECSWELKDEPGDGTGRELHVQMLKFVDLASKKGGDKEPLWPMLVKGHPEVDTSTVKREDKSIEEIMQELTAMDPDGHGLHKAQDMKKKL